MQYSARKGLSFTAGIFIINCQESKPQLYARILHISDRSAKQQLPILKSV